MTYCVGGKEFSSKEAIIEHCREMLYEKIPLDKSWLIELASFHPTIGYKTKLYMATDVWIGRPEFNLHSDKFKCFHISFDISFKSREFSFIKTITNLKHNTLPIKYNLPKGFIYYITADGGKYVKIGWALDPVKRLKQLQCGNHSKLYLLGYFPGSVKDEKSLQRWFKIEQTEAVNEWFNLSEQVKDFFTRAIIWKRDVLKMSENN